MSTDDISALRQVLEVKLDNISNSLTILNSKIETVTVAQSKDHDMLLKTEFTLERNTQDLKDHELREKEYGQGISCRLDTAEKDVSALKMQVLKITVASSTIISVIAWLANKFLG